jgi:hypothetical protein
MQSKAARTEVDRNYEEFRKILPDLLKKALGKYVVLHGGEIAEFFDTFGDAVRYSSLRAGQIRERQILCAGSHEPERELGLPFVCPASTSKLSRSAP